MYRSVYLPLVIPALLAVLAPLIVRHVRPSLAARTLAVSTAVLGLASTWGLTLLTCTLLGRAPFLVERVGWSRAAFRAHAPVPLATSFVAVAGLIATAAVLTRTVRRRRIVHDATGRIRRQCLPLDTELLVLADDVPRAFAVPGRQPAIVVSRGMLRALDGGERQVLLAHERAHLRHHHDTYQLVADLAAATSPFLGPLRHQVAYALERWADEQAADQVHSRELAARSLAKAALASAAARRPALSFERFRVTDRVTALQRSPAPTHPPFVLVVLSLVAVAGLAVADATWSMYRLLMTVIGE